MLLKSADDKSKRLALLEDLQQSRMLNPDQRKWLKDELFRLKAGIQGERDAAHYLNTYFKGGENHVILHDLRFIVDGETVQIDHLIINKAFGFYLLETKNYSGNLQINEQGEFTAVYGDTRFGIPSPIEQSRRHEKLLRLLLESLEITGRVHKQPNFFHVVMLHPKAIITRPPAKTFDTRNVIKADQFPTWHKEFVDSLGAGTVLKAILNMRTMDTLQEWGEKLCRQHRPADLLALPDFMQPKAAAAPVVRQPTRAPQQAAPASPPAPTPVTSAPETTPAKRLVCAECGGKISFAEGKFCWGNTRRFGGLQYCREHQASR